MEEEFRSDDLASNSNESIALFDESLDRLRNVPEQNLLFCVLNSENGIERFLKNPSFLSVKQVSALVELIAKACSNQTFPESSKRLLKHVTLVNFVTDQIDHYIVKQFAELTNDDLEKFSFNAFTILFHIFRLDEIHNYERLCSIVKTIELKLSQKEFSFDHVVMSKFNEVTEYINQFKENSVEIFPNVSPKESTGHPDNFREIPTFPTVADLSGSDKDYLPKNKSIDQAKNVDEYLDMQFRLMRQDFVAPIFRDINQFIHSSCKISKLKLNVYQNAQICYPIYTDRDISYVVKYDVKDLSDLERAIRPSRGRLVMLSDDRFENFIFGTVVSTISKEHSAGFVAVNFHDNVSVDGRNFVMLETFYSFSHSQNVLNKLKRFEEDNLPMHEYIIDCKSDISRPGYQLNAKITFDLSPLLQNKVCTDDAGLNYAIDDCKQWPDVSDLVVDQSQNDAIQNALTKELAIIQGPPGTGKTFVVLKIVEILLNSVADIGPILLVTRTDFALDKFLQRVIEFCKSGIVRIADGKGFTKTMNLNIDYLRKESIGLNSSKERFENEIYRRITSITEESKDTASKLRMTRAKQLTTKTCIHTLTSFSEFIRKEHVEKFFAATDIRTEDVLKRWLLDTCAVDITFAQNSEQDLQDCLTQCNDSGSNDNLPTWWSSTEMECEESIANHSKKMETVYKELSEELYCVQNCFDDETKDVTLNENQNLITAKLLSTDRMTMGEAAQIDDPWQISLDDRWRLYRLWIYEYNYAQERLSIRLEDKYNRLLKEKEELRNFQDCEIMHKAKIIGVTTSGASRYSRILDYICPKIVIVAEAAELLESHLVTSLSPGCQHLILIGDHEQLKPNASDYHLKTQFSLDMSLFERLIKHKLEYRVLNVQRLMHPDIAFAIQSIYPTLQSHISVSGNPNIRGVKERLTFVNHNKPEEIGFINKFEAHYCLALCRHLLLNGYDPKQISLLTMYNGQLSLIQQLISNSDDLGKRVWASSVGKFHGKRNDIIILSLVRSNNRDNIGFVGVKNMISQALTRAKCGLFVVGNFDLLSSKSEFWSKIVEDCRSRDFVSNGVCLQCQVHPNNVVGTAKEAEDFRNYAAEGGCNQPCLERLKCGEQCESLCHPCDREHINYKCQKVSLKLCPACEKEHEMLCSEDPQLFECTSLCTKILNCGHPCTKLCKQPCSIKCEKLVYKSMPFCKHEIEVPCYLDPCDFDCTVPCGKQLGCEHPCSGTCGSCSAGRLHIQCVQRQEGELMSCKVEKFLYSQPQYSKDKTFQETKLITIFLNRFEIKHDFKKGPQFAIQNCLCIIEELCNMIAYFETELDLSKTSEDFVIRHVWYYIRNLLRWLNPCQRYFNLHEIKQCNEEIRRINHLCEFLVGWKSAVSKKVADEWKTLGILPLLEIFSYFEAEQLEMQKLLIKLRDESTDLQVSVADKEHMQTLTTRNFFLGAWYPNTIDDNNKDTSSMPVTECEQKIEGIDISSDSDRRNHLESTLIRLSSLPDHLLLFLLMDSENGIEPFLKNPYVISVKQITAIFDLIANRTFPELSLRLLKNEILVNFVTNQIDQLIVKQYIELTSNLNEEDLEKFLCTSFYILSRIFHQFENIDYNRLSHIVKIIEIKLSQNEILVTDRILLQFQKVIEIKNQQEHHASVVYDTLESSGNFRNIPVFPTSTDFSGDRSSDDFPLKMECVDDYLGVQFRLMREELVGTLLDGLKSFKFISDVESTDKIRVYQNTQICYPICQSNKIAFILRIDLKDLSHVTWNKTTRLQSGRGVMLSCDQFETVIFGTVIFNSLRDRSKGFFAVRFHNRFHIENKRYVLLETKHFFNIPIRVLDRLQLIEPDNLPMKKYIIDCTTHIDRPAYQLSTQITFDLSPLLNNCSTQLKYAIDDCNPWPDVRDLVVDQSQYETIQNALTRELAIIQGPPGTGKTFVGLKIVEILLNSVVDIGPILVLAHTNHAIDNFLEGIFNFCKTGIVRVGTQGKSKIADSFSIDNLKDKESVLDPFKDKIEQINSVITEESKEIAKVLRMYRDKQLTTRTCIHSLTSLSGFISETQVKMFSAAKKFNTQDVLKAWLLDTCSYDHTLEKGSEEIFHNYESDVPNSWNTTDFVEEASAAWESHIVPSLNSTNKERSNSQFEYRELSAGLYSISDYFDDEFEGCTPERRKAMLTELFSSDRMSKKEADQIVDPWQISLRNRWRLYRLWIYEYNDAQERLSIPLEDTYNRLLKEKEELLFFKNCLFMLKAKVICMTTSGASAYSRILDYIRPKIVIVEEASEAWESHLVTSLSSSCQHLILIGDSEQLKPTTSMYTLAKHFGLDISLFERLINKNLEHSILSVQRRMHPDISRMLKPIYPTFQNHPFVSNYPPVRGLKERMIFVNHNEPETKTDEISDYMNEFEAHYCLALYRHLLLNGYNHSQITLLTLFKGQLQYILSRKQKPVNVFTVDNFRSKESDIIIVSLVRTSCNITNNTGFSGHENKIGMALSRAKYGLIVVGNIDLLSENCDHFHRIVNDLRKTGSLSNGIGLKCQEHPKKFVGVAKKADDFHLYSPEGGCNETCDALLNCGHQCEKCCHPNDRKHVKYICNKTVQKLCSECGCQNNILCHEDQRKFECRTPCPKILTCGHPCTKLCKQPCSTKCEEIVIKPMPFCKHEIKVPCFLDPWDFDCTEPCGKQLGCEHPCSGTCGSCSAGRLHIQCVQTCERSLVCGHICREGCFMNCPPCKENCIDECPHNRCNKPCGDRCVPCRELCCWRCKHQQCTKLCSDMCDRDFCNEPCKERFLCPQCKSNQDCVGLCGEKCPGKCRDCDPELKSILFGNEDDPHARYITIWTCGHTFEVTGLDKWMNTNEGRIQPKSCPTCRTQITKKSCWRYSNIVKSLNTNIQDAKEIQIQRKEIGEIKIQPHGFDHKLIETFLVQFYCKQDLKSGSKFASQKCLSVIDKLRKLYSQYEGKLDLINSSKSVEIQHTWYSIRNLLRWLNPCKRNFNRDEIKQCKEEFQRICHLCEFLVGWKFANPKEVRDEWMNRGVRSLIETYSYPEEQQNDMNQLLIELRGRSSELPTIPSHERLEIMMAVGFAQGDWYICPNGHPYHVGEDGAPKQLSTCPECLVAIGAPGDTGQLAPLNTRFPQMYNKLSPKNPGD